MRKDEIGRDRAFHPEPEQLDALALARIRGGNFFTDWLQAHLRTRAAVQGVGAAVVRSAV